MKKCALNKTGFLIPVILACAGLWACKTAESRPGETPPPEVEVPSQSAAPEPEAGPLLPEFAESRPEVLERDELTVALSKGEVELDFRKSYLASEAQLFTAIYEGLFSYHPFTMEPIPAVVDRWELSEDKKQWTFTIRQNAKYRNGDPVRAEDFRAAWISLLSPERESPYSSLFDVIEGAREFRTGVEKDPVKVGVSAAAEKVLTVRLNAPAAFFPAMLCHHSFSPIHPSMLNKERWAPPVSDGADKAALEWEPPLSNGPFRIAEMDEDTILLVKSDQYWDARRVSFNKITLKYMEDGDETANLWNSGEARWISGEVNLDALTDRSGIQVNAMFATHYYFIRSAEKPWDDYRIRRALSLALPWEEIRQGHFLPAPTLIFPIRGYPEIAGLTEPDIEEAARLLAEAGYAGGLGLPELVIRLTPSQEAARIGGIMAQTWKEGLGIPVRVEVIPYNQYFQSMKGSGYIVGSSTWIGDFADPYTFLQMWRRDSNLNDARYNDEDYEKLLERSMLEEGDTRLATLAEAEKLLLDRGSVLPVSYSPAINVVDTNELDGWYPNALDIHPFKYLNFKAFRPLPGVVYLNGKPVDCMRRVHTQEPALRRGSFRAL
ncbi:MAG: peptide ABC transporter substrate-binding protein [Treponema sp.]|jgi:peptide/nickel transport system substrate-binding protein/oligopeptide transport system substrate-binding protein|nr:peptide ABC transporter substrate-binding protein [Treponema sp.]